MDCDYQHQFPFNELTTQPLRTVTRELCLLSFNSAGLYYVYRSSLTSCRRSVKRSVANTSAVREQLDDIEDHRPFFTYWVTTVQVLILIISLTCYGLGPVGIDLNHRSGQVSYSYQNGTERPCLVSCSDRWLSSYEQLLLQSIIVSWY